MGLSPPFSLLPCGSSFFVKEKPDRKKKGLTFSQWQFTPLFTNSILQNIFSKLGSGMEVIKGGFLVKHIKYF